MEIDGRELTRRKKLVKKTVAIRNIATVTNPVCDCVLTQRTSERQEKDEGAQGGDFTGILPLGDCTLFPGISTDPSRILVNPPPPPPEYNCA